MNFYNPVKRYLVPLFAAILLVPAHALGQTATIDLLDNFGTFERGDDLFLFGNIAITDPDAFLILQVINPSGDICRIQQLTPLSGGAFVTEPIPLQGRICGMPGDYEVRLFYGSTSTDAAFTVSGDVRTEPTGAQTLSAAGQAVSDLLAYIDSNTKANTAEYRLRLNQQASDLAGLERLYADIWADLYTDEMLLEVDPAFRPVVASSLESTAALVAAGEITSGVARDIDRSTYTALFYHELGDTKRSVDIINDAFVSIQNADPVKPAATKTRTFAELESALSNLMTKTGSILSREVKEELAFIFARGTAPLYAAELNQMLDMLTESRYLDVVSRKNAPLYRLINTSWEGLKESLIDKASVERLLDARQSVNDLYTAALLLRELDDADRFISDEEDNTGLAALIEPTWGSLESRLQLATSVDDILEASGDIYTMRDVIDISSRISKVVDLSRDISVNTGLISDWEDLLDRVEGAGTLDEVLSIVSEFDRSITDMREKRDPVTILRFEYEKMKTRAELQADYDNLNVIERALRILNVAQEINTGKATVSKIDRIEVLLSWVSAMAPVIADDLDSYSGDIYKERASDILQRAQSIEDLAELSLTTKRFLPGYTDFVDSVLERVDRARNLVIADDLDGADRIVRDLFDEWQEVTKAYSDDPYGSEVGYSSDELLRIEYRKKLDNYASVVSNFYNADFAPHSAEYNAMHSNAHQQIDRGNFETAEGLITDIGRFLSEKLALQNPSIIYDISPDTDRSLWLASGFIQRHAFDDRKEITMTVYDMNGQVRDTYTFSTTREGKIYTQWHAPTDPGLYVAVLDHAGQQASRLVFIEETFEREFDQADIDIFALADEFEDLESFIERFGGTNYAENSPRFAPAVERIEEALRDRDASAVERNLDDLKRLIERYLPTRARTAVIDAQYDGNRLVLSGAVEKAISFSEDLFVDVFNQKGERVREILLKDTASGHFDEAVSLGLSPGTYVAQLEYHDVIVNDFFVVR